MPFPCYLRPLEGHECMRCRHLTRCCLPTSKQHAALRLYLPFNCIKEVGSSLDSLEQLEVLWLAGNQLRCLKALELPNLTELNLASNQLTTVIGAFERMPKLQLLSCA